MECGVQYVMTFGVLRMLEWFADNLDYQQNVRILKHNVPNTENVHYVYYSTYILLQILFETTDLFFFTFLYSAYYNNCSSSIW